MSELKFFDFLKSITYTKEDLSNHPQFYEIYNPFMINRWLSMTDDMMCLSLAMYLSENDYDKLSHYKFLLYGLRKKFIKFDYQKFINDDLEDGIGYFYNVNKLKSREIIKLLNNDQKDEFRKLKRINGG